MPLYKTAALFMVVVLFAAVSRSEDPDGNKIKTSLNAGLTLTDGNSETMLGNVSLIIEGESKRLGSLRTGAEFNYGDSKTNEGEKENTVSNAKMFANAKKGFSERAFAAVDAAFFHDDIASISYRVTAGPAVGYYLLKNERIQFSAEAGPSYLVEKVGGSENDHFVLRLADRLEWRISETANCWQAAEYLPQVDDPGNYLLNAEVGVEAAMTARLRLRLVLQDMYNSRPAEGKKKNDLTLIAGVGFTL